MLLLPLLVACSSGGTKDEPTPTPVTPPVAATAAQRDAAVNTPTNAAPPDASIPDAALPDAEPPDASPPHAGTVTTCPPEMQAALVAGWKIKKIKIAKCVEIPGPAKTWAVWGWATLLGEPDPSPDDYSDYRQELRRGVVAETASGYALRARVNPEEFTPEWKSLNGVAVLVEDLDGDGTYELIEIMKIDRRYMTTTMTVFCRKGGTLRECLSRRLAWSREDDTERDYCYSEWKLVPKKKGHSIVIVGTATGDMSRKRKETPCVHGREVLDLRRGRFKSKLKRKKLVPTPTGDDDDDDD